MTRYKYYTVAVEFTVPGEKSRAASGNFVELEYVKAWNTEDAKRKAEKWITEGGGCVSRVAVKGTKVFHDICESNKI